MTNPYASMSEDQLLAALAGLAGEFANLVNEDAMEDTFNNRPETWEKMRKAFSKWPRGQLDHLKLTHKQPWLNHLSNTQQTKKH